MVLLVQVWNLNKPSSQVNEQTTAATSSRTQNVQLIRVLKLFLLTFVNTKT